MIGHHLEQWWLIISWTLGMKLLWNFNQEANIVLQKKCIWKCCLQKKKFIVLFRLQCVNRLLITWSPLTWHQVISCPTCTLSSYHVSWLTYMLPVHDWWPLTPISMQNLSLWLVRLCVIDRLGRMGYPLLTPLTFMDDVDHCYVSVHHHLTR